MHLAKTATLTFAALLIGVVATDGLNAQQPTRPLPVEGKKTLYQRVIAVPGAVVVDSAGASTEDVPPVTPFTVFYVYARNMVDGREWLEVGTDSNGTVTGWLPAEQGIDWKQTLTVGFKDPAKQPRVLLFNDRQALKDIVDRGDADAYRNLRMRAENGDVAGTPVAAIQPDSFIDIRRNFYLVPILSHEDVLVDGYQGRLLQVASVPLQSPSPAEDPYRAAIVFVIDTTVSMQPYIDSTRQIMRRVYDDIANAGLADKVAYGLVAVRDNTDAAPGLGYTARVEAGLTTDADQFLSDAAKVRAATVSSQGFDEDAYAGIRAAVDSIDWDDYFARYVILITDAGPRLAGDPLSTTGLDTAGAHKLLLDKRIAPWVIHLRTPRGADDHAFAEQQYRSLSTVDDIGAFYYPVQTGDVDAFETALTAVTKQLTTQVGAAAQGFAPLTSGAAQGAGGSELAAFQEKVSRLGYALRMRYLQQAAGGGVPNLFNAWMIDRDFDDPEKRSIDVRVLLTRDQLSDLYDVLRRVVNRAEEGALAPQGFLDELRSLAAIVSRDPEAVQGAENGASLADLGYMREYIEGLPYHSEVMNLDLSDWQQWSAQQQFEFINQLDSKVAYYRALHDNLDLWVSLDGGPVDGDSVYPLLLEALP
jgi:serine/threonine-protein kinase PpkA